MAFGNNGSVSRNTALSVLLVCLMLGVLIGLSPISPIDRAASTAIQGLRTPNLRDTAPIVANVVDAPIEETQAVVAPIAEVVEPVAEVAEDKSGLNWPASRKMVEDEDNEEQELVDQFAEGEGAWGQDNEVAEGQGAWGPDNEEMEDWVDLWGGVDLVGAVDADLMEESESFDFSYAI